MKYAEIRKLDSANGPGIRVSLFVTGCNIKCPGCFNKELQDFEYGKEFTLSTLNEIFEYLKHPHVRGLTILGGEPFSAPNTRVVAIIVQEVREMFPEKDIWCYTGYRLEDLKYFHLMGHNRSFPTIREKENSVNIKSILKNIDVLVDGPFIQESKRPGLRFKGSSNQRIIDMKKTIEQNKIILSKYND